MSDLVEMLGFVACVGLIAGVIEFWMDPEETANRLGRCIAAFRLGLRGQKLEKSGDESSDTSPPKIS
jgi:hypothetical protein